MNNRTRIVLGLILIILGINLLLSNYVREKRELVFSNMNMELSIPKLEIFNEEPEENIETEEPEEEEESNEESKEEIVNYETYTGILNIPKIGFSRGFYKKESSLNNVSFNIKIINESAYPDEDKGNVIIIGHSGNYSNSYFANLYQLELNDLATITYEGKKYTYKVTNIYTDTKNGTITILRDITKNTLTLITCTKDDETTQTVYIMNLLEVE
ncbi:MAG: sortase [Bacilli bacterium]|nr:sortase [Bacilli bacterium]